jgi:uncharacterized membrane protein
MMLGYAYGPLYGASFSEFKRRKLLFVSGIVLVCLFVAFRYINGYGDPAKWSVQNTWALTLFSFFNVTKYPCSLLYLVMTLGPALIFLSLSEQVKGKLSSILVTYGNVPFFFYILHFYLLRLINVALFFAQGYSLGQIEGPRPFYFFQPAGFGYGLLGVYLVWLLVGVLLYFPCRWFGNYKGKHGHWWLGYL